MGPKAAATGFKMIYQKVWILISREKSFIKNSLF
nr:MAG TPA: hypothetical protein [Caudoviricetes sp.]